MNKLFKSIIVLVLVSWSTFAYANNPDVLPPKQMKWSFDGPLGNFDRTSIQRGFKVYKEVCAACHSVKHLYFRNLQEIGFSAEEVKSLAASYMVKDGPNDEGEYFERPGKPFDRIPGPYANDNAARASNNGALPPDLSYLHWYQIIKLNIRMAPKLLLIKWHKMLQISCNGLLNLKWRLENH